MVLWQHAQVFDCLVKLGYMDSFYNRHGRSMMSQVNCGKTGFAQVPPLALTITNIVLQYIEHLDYQGFSGNLSDMLALYLENDKNLGNYKNSDRPQLFIKNMKIQALLVPPEHRSAVGPLLKQMAALT